MTTESPRQRLSDAERDDAVSMLREHFEAGRLEASEFSDRMGTALAARFATDLAPLFADLPDPRPASLGLPPPAWPALEEWAPVPADSYPPAPWTGSSDVATNDNTQRVLSVVQALVWPVAVLLLITGNGVEWIFIAIIVTVILKALQSGQRRRPPPYLGQ